MHTFSRVACFSIVALIWQCSSATRSVVEEPEVKTIVRVENNNVLDMRIYVVRNTQKVRIGFVPSHTTRELVIPNYLISGIATLRLLADPVGGRGAPISEEFTVLPGEVIEMYISN